MPLNDRRDLAELTKYFLGRADRYQEDQFDRQKEIRQRAFWSLVIASSLSAIFASILSKAALDERTLVLIPCLITVQALSVAFLLMPMTFGVDSSGSSILDEIDQEEKISRFEDQMIRILRMKEDLQKENEKNLERLNRLLIFVYFIFFTQLGVWFFLLWSSLLRGKGL